MDKPIKKGKIAIASTGRFHVLDLARELHALGYDVAFYSYVPWFRAKKFGLPKACHRSLFLFALPFLAMLRFLPKKWDPSIQDWLSWWLDWVMSKKLKSCDILIAMSGAYLKVLRVAKDRYNAAIFLERGSRHILSQKKILDALLLSEAQPSQVTANVVDRELAGYAIADLIVIPSKHVERSFLEFNVPLERLRRNPYGVDLNVFKPLMLARDDRRFTLIFVGAWSLRKGVDILVKAWEPLSQKINLLHVGPILDASLPESPSFLHIDPVPQWQLPNYYTKADAFVLASREEGLAMVLAQAMACGLPLICTDRTGGEDLAEVTQCHQSVHIIPSDNVEALQNAIHQGMNEEILKRDSPDNSSQILTKEARERLSWRAYGQRYAALISEYLT